MCGTEEVVVLGYNVTDYMYICVDRTDNLTILNLHFIAQSAESPLQARNVQNIICHSFIF